MEIVAVQLDDKPPGHHQVHFSNVGDDHAVGNIYSSVLQLNSGQGLQWAASAIAGALQAIPAKNTARTA